VVDLVSKGVFLRVAAPVVGLAIVALALHTTLAEAAVDEAFEYVRVTAAVLLVFLAGTTATPVQDLLDLLEEGAVDQGRMDTVTTRA
jgi:hypothetical protein